MASIKEIKDKNGKIISYRVQVRLKGHPPQSSNHKRLTDARKWAQDIESAIRQGRHFKTTEAKKHTVGELIDRYIRDVLPMKPKSEKKQKAQLLWWKEQIGFTTLASTTPALLGEQRDKLARQAVGGDKPRSPSTVVRYMAALSHAFTIAVKEWGWLEDSPMRKVTRPREPRGRVRFLSDDERARLLEVCKASPSPYLYPAVVLALSTGMRQMELMTLKWSNVDLIRGTILLEETKNGERRSIPLAGLALRLLQELDKKRRLDTMLLFPGRDPRYPVNLRTAWEKALKMAAIEDFVWHSLRHSTASYLIMNGASLAEVAHILGHRQISVTQRYAHLSKNHAAGVVANMNERIFG